MSSSSTCDAPPSGDGGARGRSRACWAALVVVLVIATRIASIYTESINWDEFAILARADGIAETGVWNTGGRPGLAMHLLVPFARSCSDEIEAIRDARLLWLGLTIAYLAGLAVMLTQMQADPRRRLGDAAVGVGLLALLPVFLEWSIQVRTDQIALAGGVWGGVVLLASQQKNSRLAQAALGFVSGTLFGVGYLGSQKAIYVAALVSILALARIHISRDLKPQREAIRALACAAGFILVFQLFRSALEASLVTIPAAHVSEAIVSKRLIQSGLWAFDYYRKTIGYSQYLALLPSLGPHFVMAACLVAASTIALRRRIRAPALLTAWVILAAGIGVGWFHAAAFSYFWMTLGLFPAAAFAVSRSEVLALVLPQGSAFRGAAFAGWWALLAVPGAVASLTLLVDTQAVQRESLAFVHRNFDPSDSGFHPESALFCQEGAQPIGTYFSQKIFADFARSESARKQRISEFLETHRSKPIRFLVQSFRLNQFPLALRTFWADNYQPYRASVFVAGRRLLGARGTHSAFEVIVPGAYRWLPRDGPQHLWIERAADDGTPTKEGSGQLVAAGQIVKLEPGAYNARFVEDVAEGLLVLAMNEPPGPAPQLFYKAY